MTVTARGRAAGAPPPLQKWIFLVGYRLTGHSQEWERLARLAGEEPAQAAAAGLEPAATDTEPTA
jgi:hypothetical protein